MMHEFRGFGGPHAKSIACLLAALITFALSPPAASQTEGSAAKDEALTGQSAAAMERATADAKTQPEGTATSDQPASPQLWTLSASAGLSARDGGPDGSWQSLSLSRRIGRGYVRASAMRYNGTLTQADTALPSNYYIGTLAAGGNFDNWVGDAWISYGRQVYGKITTDTGSRESTGSRASDYYALGADFGRTFILAPSWYLTPTVAGSFAQGKLLRVAPSETELPDLETDEPTFNASATVRIDHAFGARDNHYVGLLASRHWSSNGLSQVVVGAFDPADGSPIALDSDHRADGWFELGGTGSMQVSTVINLDFYATRSFGVAAGNTTSAGITLRTAF